MRMTERMLMPTRANMLNRYKADAVDTMSPAKAVVALYDRLVLDLDRAIAALSLDRFGDAHAHLVHAQDIVAELSLSLDVEQWPAGAALLEVYRWVHAELIAANVEKDAARIAACRELVSPLRDTWHEALGQTPAGGDAA
jgi:flagellar protein FliS